jgi:FMN phosphatase YigB (HAD superfamily)
VSRNLVWLFDLDNTLHNASHAIFPAINDNWVWCDIIAYVQMTFCVKHTSLTTCRK